MRRSSPLLGFLLAALDWSAHAQPDGRFEELPEPPDIPPRVQSGEVIEPDVRIIRRERETITEYRVDGRLRAVKVEPDGMPAYYLVDSSGDGRLDTRTRELEPRLLVPQWILFSW